MKITPNGDGTFTLASTPEDADEDGLQSEIESIVRLAQSMERHGTSREQRVKDRGGYWRSCENERSLMLIRDSAARALQFIEWLDFPEEAQPPDRRKRH